MVRTVLVLTLPAAASSSCVGESCLVKGSALLQHTQKKLLQAEVHEELEDHAEVLAKLKAQAEQEVEQEAEKAAQAGGHEDYICVATGEKAEKCMTFPHQGQQKEFCWPQNYHDSTCQWECEKDTAKCEEGGKLHKACRCSDVSAAAVAACDRKSGGDACDFTTEKFETLKGTKEYVFNSICHDHEGALTCMAIRRLECYNGRRQSDPDFEWKPAGSPCVKNLQTTSGRSGTPTSFTKDNRRLSHCVKSPYKKGEMWCTTDSSDSGLPAEIKGELEKELMNNTAGKILKFWSGQA